MTTIPCQFTSPERNKKNCGRTALYTLKRASLTVEAAVILPVFLLAMLMLLSVIDICRVKVESQAELTARGKQLSMYAYLTPELYGDNYVDLYKIETYELPVKLFPFPDIKLALRARIHTWTGRSETDESGGTEDFDGTEAVYVTERQTVYHTSSQCSHLDLSIIQTDQKSLQNIRNEYGNKYHACDKCCGNYDENSQGNHSGAGSGNVCYVTGFGDSYHVSMNCSSLKRTTKLVQLEDVSHLKECERCKLIREQ